MDRGGYVTQCDQRICILLAFDPVDRLALDDRGHHSGQVVEDAVSALRL
jgi:hypothetical protein